MRQHNLSPCALGRPPTGDPCYPRQGCRVKAAPRLLSTARSCLRSPRLHRQAQPNANTSMVATTAGLANRRSSSMLRLHQTHSLVNTAAP